MPALSLLRAQCWGGKQIPCWAAPVPHPPHSHPHSEAGPTSPRLMAVTASSPQLKARCEELKLDWSTLSLENLLKEKQALRSQISEKQRRCLELQVGPRTGASASLGFSHGVRNMVRAVSTPSEAALLSRTGYWLQVSQ